MNKFDTSYFSGKINEDFIKYFLDELYVKIKFTQYDDPDDFFDPEQEYGMHITETQDKLSLLIKTSISRSGKNLNSEEEQIILNHKKEELFTTLLPLIDIYIKKVEVDYK